MNKKKTLVRRSFEIATDLFAGPFLWLLIWGGAIIAFANHGELLLSILLTLSGFAWAYKEHKRISGANQKGDEQ